jgi:general secretion pathway protein D
MSPSTTSLLCNKDIGFMMKTAIFYGCRIGLFVIIVFLSGCIAGQSSFKEGNKALEQENFDQAVLQYLSAVEDNPNKSEYRLKLYYARHKGALSHKTLADMYFEQQRYAQALQEYQLAVDLDGGLFAASDGVRKSKKSIQVEQLVREAESMIQSNRQNQARASLDNALSLVPDHPKALELNAAIKKSLFALVDGVELEVTSTHPIDLNFNKTSLPDVFKILTQLSGINFILDEGVRDNKTTLFIEKATFAQALELLLRMNKLDKKILNSKTIILYPKTRDKQKQFEDQIIQTFYLSHMDAKKAVNMLRTMLQVRKIFVQEELNAIVLRDQPEVIKLAAKMLEANDRGNAEVVFDLELIEVNHSDTRELGVKLSNYSVGAGLGKLGSDVILDSGLSAGGSTLNLLASSRELNPFDTNLESFYSIPTATFRFLKTEVDAEVLANPKIRVRNKQKAKVHVGTREPVVTVTLNDTQTSENVTYLDVGVKLDVEPTVQLDNTIVTKIGLEVSNVSGRDKTTNGTAVITISSTTANTTLTLKDGEQTVIGGLIRDDSSLTKSKIPVLGDIPLLGEAFNGRDSTKSKREILLSITPHIVKAIQLPQADIASIWSGSEEDLKFGRSFGTFADEYSDITGLPQESIDSDAVEQLERTDIEGVRTVPADQGQLEPSSVIEEKAPVEEMPQSKVYKPISFVSGPKQAGLDDLLTLNVILGSIKDMVSATLDVEYDPKNLDYIEFGKGKLLTQENDNISITVTPAEQEGRLLIVLDKASKQAGITGGGELLTLTFKPVMPGKIKVKTANVYLDNIHKQSSKAIESGATFEILP